MEIETHPFQPWLPRDSTLLMLGTFPPSEKRWCMPWYYPNYTNDMWRIFGVVFFNDPNHFVDQPRRTYKLQELKQFLLEKRIAIFDTALRIERTKGTASDKDLRIVEQADIDHLLEQIPQCKAILTAGQLATQTLANHYDISIKNLKMGSYTTFIFHGRSVRLYRQPSSSRAYPLSLLKKAEFYRQMFVELREI